MTPQMCQYAIASGLALVLDMLGSRCFGFCGLWPTHCTLPRFHRNILPCRCSLWSLVSMDDETQPSQLGIQHSLGACVSLGSFCCCGWWPTGTSAVPSQLFCHVAVWCDHSFRAEVAIAPPCDHCAVGSLVSIGVSSTRADTNFCCFNLIFFCF